MTNYLLPISDRDALRWIVTECRTAFGEHRRREAAALEVGDALYLYTTRGCFRNPTRDRGRVIGRAVVAAPASRVTSPPRFGEVEYPYVVKFQIETLAPLRSGLELAPLIPKLVHTFPDSATWAVRMRRALVPLDPRDARILGVGLSGVANPYAESSQSYRTGH